MRKRIEILGIPFDPVTYEQAIEQIEFYVGDSNQVYCTTPNPEMVINANNNPDFKKILQNAALAIPDGIGIIWASYYLSLKLPKTKLGQYIQLISSLGLIIIAPKRIRKVLPARITGTDLFCKTVQYSQQSGWRIFLLGAQPGVAEKAITNLSNQYPQANFVGNFAGSSIPDAEDSICQTINQAKPDILFIAYGSPDQEMWIHRNLHKLETVKVAIGVGGAFDFSAGIIKRAPKWMQKSGLEWLWRLMQEPSRIHRICNATYAFIRLIMQTKIKQKVY